MTTRTITDEMLRDQSNRIDATLDDIAAHIPGALAEAEARGRSRALSEVEAAVTGLRADPVKYGSASAAYDAACWAVLAAIAALREGTKA